MPDLKIRGLPLTLANEAKLLDDIPVAQTGEHKTTKDARDQFDFAPLTIIAILCLIFLADFLFWDHPVGISLVLFSTSISAVALVNLKPQFHRQEWLMLLGIWVLAAFPIVEYLQMISVAFLVIGHTGLLVWCATRSDAGPLTRALVFLPFGLVSFSTTRIINLAIWTFRGKATITQSTLATSLLPLVTGLVFLSLFIGANPVFQKWVNNLLELDISADAFTRVVFWGATGLLVLPFALFKGLASHLPLKPKAAPKKGKSEDTLINALSIRNSLILFNAMFLMQNVTDLTVLWGNSGLPENMTYAEYAHSGAYPLMASSILAGLFALVARRFTLGSSLIKLLLLIWIAQNIILLSSAILRLDLYIDAYGLTYLRVRAGIGMFLVLAGMILMVWQLWRSKTNAWLTGTFATVAVCVFYTCSFVNFGYVIASVNLLRDDGPHDFYYMCRDTPTGVKAFLEYQTATGLRRCLSTSLKLPFLTDNWRGYSLRTIRMEDYRRAYIEG